MTNHFELLESKRKHIISYSQEKVPEKKIVEDALYKAWKTQPSKNNMMAYYVDVYGPDKQLYNYTKNIYGNYVIKIILEQIKNITQKNFQT